MSTIIDFRVIPSSQLPRFHWDTDTIFQGVVRFPANTQGTNFGYNSKGIALTPSGTLFAVGKSNDATTTGQQVAELILPAPKNVSILSQALTASVKQQFKEPSEGLFKLASVPGTYTKIGDLLVYNNKLYVSYFAYYDANSSQVLSQISRHLDLSVTGQVKGPFHLSPTKPFLKGDGTNTPYNPTRFVNGYMLNLSGLAANLFKFPCLMGSIAENISAGSSNGPDFVGWNPDTLAANSPVTPFTYYPEPHALGPWNQTSSVWNSTSRIGGVTYIEGTSTILAAGMMGVGNWTYGSGGQLPNGDNWAYDPIYTTKGTHAYPYQNQIWAFDIYDILNATTPWGIKPYAIYKLNLPFTSTVKLLDGSKAIAPGVGNAGGIAYDSINKIVIISQGAADGSLPLLYFFGVK